MIYTALVDAMVALAKHQVIEDLVRYSVFCFLCYWFVCEFTTIMFDCEYWDKMISETKEHASERCAYFFF